MQWFPKFLFFLQLFFKLLIFFFVFSTKLGIFFQFYNFFLFLLKRFLVFQLNNSIDINYAFLDLNHIFHFLFWELIDRREWAEKCCIFLAHFCFMFVIFQVVHHYLESCFIFFEYLNFLLQNFCVQGQLIIPVFVDFDLIFEIGSDPTCFHRKCLYLLIDVVISFFAPFSQ